MYYPAMQSTINYDISVNTNKLMLKFDALSLDEADEILHLSPAILGKLAAAQVNNTHKQTNSAKLSPRTPYDGENLPAWYMSNTFARDPHYIAIKIYMHVAEGVSLETIYIRKDKFADTLDRLISTNSLPRISHHMYAPILDDISCVTSEPLLHSYVQIYDNYVHVGYLREYAASEQW